MEFEWDERKRVQIVAARKLDFFDADLFFDGRPVSFSADLPHGRGALEDDRGNRRLVSDFGVVLARRKNPRDYDEASA